MSKLIIRLETDNFETKEQSLSVLDESFLKNVFEIFGQLMYLFSLPKMNLTKGDKI